MIRYLVIGGVAAGMSAAARLRRLDEHAQITVLERGPHISYANCGLPYYLGGIIRQREKLLIQTPHAFGRRFNVDVRVNHEVLRIDPAAKKLLIRDIPANRTYQENYDKLILTPGGSPIRPSIPGIDHPAIFSLWTLADADRIKGYLDTHHPAHCVIVGAGFIGLEMAECLHHRGIQVALVEALHQVLPGLDFEMAAIVHRHLQSKGIPCHLGDPLVSFSDWNGQVDLELKSGKRIATSMVLLSIGIRPNKQLAVEAGLKIGERGGITVNEYLQTSDADIYAAGDAIEVAHPLLNHKTLIPLAGPANKQGRIVADNLVLGNKHVYHGTLGTWVVKVFDLTVAATGLSEKLCREESIPCRAVVVHPQAHASYYPGSGILSLKLLFAPDTGKVLGAQAVGRMGVEKRIDVLATAIQAGMTVYDLTEIEHAYAPPYSSAKDPIHMAGFVAENVLQGRVRVVTWEEALEVDRMLTHFLDVRTDGEYHAGHIEGAQHIPLDDLRQRLQEIPEGKRIIAYCQVGLRGYFAARILMQNGFTEIYNLTGGYETYKLAAEQ